MPYAWLSHAKVWHNLAINTSQRLHIKEDYHKINAYIEIYLEKKY